MESVSRTTHSHVTVCGTLGGTIQSVASSGNHHNIRDLHHGARGGLRTD